VTESTTDVVTEAEAHEPGLHEQGFTVWFTGLSGAGKSTLADLLVGELKHRGVKVELLDGDIVRTNLSKGLGFSKEDRDTNILRIGFVAHLLARNGVAVVVSAISPYKHARDQVRAMAGDFIEVYVNAPLDVCEHRDVKGLYAMARSGDLPGFTGIDDPYEPPDNPELELRTDQLSPTQCLEKLLGVLDDLNYLPPR
jgi:adenylylsulfate kinase